LTDDGVALGEPLAKALGIGVGDEIILRVEKPSLLSRDAPLSKIDDATVAISARVDRVLTDREFGRFNLSANQVPPFNCFLPRSVLQKAVGIADTANLLLVGPEPGHAPSDLQSVNRILWKHWGLEDASLEIREAAGRLELRTGRVFLEPAIARIATEVTADHEQVLTYFVNRLESGGRSAPYSTVAAMTNPPGPKDLRDDEIVVNQWLADDIGVRVGDRLRIAYWVVGPLRKLEEKTTEFRVRAIVPIEGAAADPTLMPDIPGLTDKKDCREWEPGVPIDLDRIRDKDQDWWTRYKGTPKAFVTIRSGQEIWQNRFGDLTAVRWEIGDARGRVAVEEKLRRAVNAASLGVLLTPVAAAAASATDASFDFGQLFLGLSLFLIVSALVLAALMFGFLAERRSTEAGILKAVGWDDASVARLFLIEASVAAVIGGLIGMLGSVVYANWVIEGLGGAWSDAVAGTDVNLHPAIAPVIVGGMSGTLLGIASMAGVLRLFRRTPARTLLTGPVGELLTGRRRGIAVLVAVLGTFAGVLWAVLAAIFPAAGGPGGFFGAGALLLIGGIASVRGILAIPETPVRPSRLSVLDMTLRFARRRPGRSAAVALLFALGTFLVVAVGANRPDNHRDGLRRDSGTGGFAWWVETSLPVFQDLNTADGRETFGLDETTMAQAAIVPIRVREGDDASCLNLNRAQDPRILGVDPEALSRRSAFHKGGKADDPWSLLRAEQETIPVIGDTNTIVWSLGRKLGDSWAIRDDNGILRRLRVVAVLPNSILQGALVMNEADFIRLFPRRAGYQAFLVDAPVDRRTEIGEELSAGLEDVGVGLESAVERLAGFQAVEETYLSIFGLLGGLGLLLGTGGLAVVVQRNVGDRRSEIAALRAVGFSRRVLVRLLVLEHTGLLVVGMTIGLIAALVAVAPVIARNEQGVPWGTLIAPLAAVVVVGILSTVLSTLAVMRGRLVDSLRND
jgi:putative ABC transport system permease protein